jgi:integrase/recombinase XerC
MSDDLNRAHIAAYLGSLKSQRQLADMTVSSYARDLEVLARDTKTLPGEPPLSAVSPAHIRKFTAQMHAHSLNARSIARALSAWRGFFNWLADQVEMPRNPVDGIKAPKRTQPLPKALSADDAVRLVSQSAQTVPDASDPAAACNRAMFELLYSSGLRVSELAGLDLLYVQQAGYNSAGWIDFDAHTVTVTGKGKKMRSVPVGQPAMVAIADWIALRPMLVKADPHPLFLSARGSRITPRLVQLRLKDHARKLGIPSDVHPHVLRHSFASHVLQSSGDLRAVQEMLGHASITSTQVYTSLDFLHLSQVYDAAHPRAKKRSGTP